MMLPALFLAAVAVFPQRSEAVPNAGEAVAISFQDLAQRALANNPWIVAKRARAESLRHTNHQKRDESSWRGWDLGFDAEYYPGTGGSSQLAGYDTRMSLGLTVPLFGSQAERNLRLQEIQAEQAIADGEIGDTNKIVLSSLLGHYLVYERGIAMRESLAQIEETLRRKRATLEARVREGESLPADLLQAERDLASVALRIAQNREAMHVALEGMRVDCGDPLLAEFSPKPLSWREIALQSPEPVELLAARAVQGHAIVQGLERRIRLLHEQEEETGFVYPRSAFTVGLVSQSGGAGGSESGPALSFSMSLPLGASRILRERQKAIAGDRDRYHADLFRKSQEIGAEIRGRHRELLVAQQRAKLAESQWQMTLERERVAILQAKELPDFAEPSLLLRALDAEIDRLEASLQKNAALSELSGSYYRVLLASGETVPTRRSATPHEPVTPMAAGSIGDLDLWVWDAAMVFDHGERRRFFELAERIGVSGIYLGLDAREADRLWDEEPGQLRGFLAECHERGIRVDCLLAENSWAIPGSREGFQELAARLVRFQEGGTRATRYDSLHLDVEPHALPEWGRGEESQAALVRGYLSMLEAARGTRMSLVADIPSWYERVKTDEGDLLGSVLRRADGIVVMNYRSEAKRFAAEAAEEVERAEEMGKTVRVGVSAESSLPESQSFRDWAAMTSMLSQAAPEMRKLASFSGFSVQSLADLERILPGNATPSDERGEWR